MPVGKGILVVLEAGTPEQMRAFQAAWADRIPDVPCFVVGPAQIVQRGEITLFEFTGDISPTLVAEFQRWWEGVTRA